MLQKTFSQKQVRNRGTMTAEVLVVGDCPTEYEDSKTLQAFTGSTGIETEKLLSEARFVASACRYVHVIPRRPLFGEAENAFGSSKKEATEKGLAYFNGRYCYPPVMQGLEILQAEIAAVRPKVILAMGNIAMWALTGKDGIDDWRGSELPQTLTPEHQCMVMPTFAPQTVLRAWELRHVVLHDIKRAREIYTVGPTKAPEWRFILRPNFPQVMEYLDLCESLDGELAVDIETKKRHIVCAAIAIDELTALCIPFVRADGGNYWSQEEEIAIVLRLQKILSTKKVAGQNFHYDAQYFARRHFVIPECSFDTMLAQHLLFPGTPKSLAYNSSLYCPYHVFWKDDGKEWDPRIHSEEQLWSYNCVDAVKTFEVMRAQKVLLAKYGLTEQFAYLMRLWPHVLLTMLRGVRILPDVKQAAVIELETALNARKRWLSTVAGYELNVASPKQMKEFFYEQLGVKPIKNFKTKRVSLDKKALAEIEERHPILSPIVQTIEEIRSLSVFLNTFAKAPLDEDLRMRCSFNMAGAETFRFSSSENAFGSGGNLQNIPSGNRSTTLVMPNMRKLFAPDMGKEIAEVDLAGADAQVVAWESNDDILKAAFRAKVKIHTVNAKDLFGGDAGPDGKREPYYTMAKQGVHATNYLCTPPTLAKTLGISVHEADKFQKRWFDIHPGIKDWHERVQAGLAKNRTVANRFGFRRVYFERIEGIAAEAVAWIPQSTVAIVVNWGFIKAGECNLPVEVLMQVHDSLVFQYPAKDRDLILGQLRPILLTPVPYEDPLTIDFGLKISSRSWGHIEEYAWPTLPGKE